MDLELLFEHLGGHDRTQVFTPDADERDAFTEGSFVVRLLSSATKTAAR